MIGRMRNSAPADANVLDTRKIVIGEKCCHNMSRDMSQNRRHSFDLSMVLFR